MAPEDPPMEDPVLTERATMWSLLGALYNGQIPTEFHDLLRRWEWTRSDRAMSPTSRAALELEMERVFDGWLTLHPDTVWHVPV